MIYIQLWQEVVQYIVFVQCSVYICCNCLFQENVPVLSDFLLFGLHALKGLPQVKEKIVKVGKNHGILVSGQGNFNFLVKVGI